MSGLEKSAQDELGQEIVEDAWVWKVYNDEATKADEALFEACNRGMDVLLVFVSVYNECNEV